MASKRVLFTFMLLLGGFFVYAQEEPKDELPTYQRMYDDPYNIRNFFLQFQPLYGDVGAMNITGGFGIEGAYYHRSLFDVQLAFRTSYGKKFDINRDAAIKNATNANDFSFFYDLEFGGTYHLRDVMTESSSVVLLYNDQLKGREWASSMAHTAEITGKVRNVIGLRLGGLMHSTTANINAILVNQDKQLYYSEGTPVFDETLYSHLQTFTIYMGGSYSWIRNYAVEFSEQWDPSGDDKILTPFLDFMYAPSISLDDLNLPREVVSTDPIDKQAVGFRAGLNVKYNRGLSWGYGLEGGMRPGIKNAGWYFMFKMSFPVYAKQLKKEASSSEQRLLPKLKFFRRNN